MNTSFIQKKSLIIFLLAITAFSINQYFGYVGIMPLDSFLVFNSAYDIFLGFTPFKDFWSIKEVFIDLMQFALFKIFGVSWFVYVMHASLMNALLVISTFLILDYFKLSRLINLILCICLSGILYPLSGTPFSDFHSTIFSLVALYIFLFAVKSNNSFVWFFLPIIMMFAFFSKQTPAAYLIIIISFFSLIYFSKNFNIKKILYGLIGTIFSFLLIWLFLFFNKINFNDFLIQSFLFPQSLGETRTEWLFPLEFKRIFLRFKYIHLSTFFIIYAFFKLLVLRKSENFNDKLILLTLYFTSIFFIIHQLMTINAIFIFCLVPIMIGFSLVYFPINNLKLKKVLVTILILISFSNSVYYFNTYVQKRTFMDLKNVDLKNSLRGELLHPMLKDIKWITPNYKDNAELEIELLKDSMNILNNDLNKYMLISDYQIISVLTNRYDFAPIRFWYEFHGYPDQSNKYFNEWKRFFLNNVSKNKIEKFYILGKLHGSINPLNDIYGETCQKNTKLNEMLNLITIKDCVP